MIPIADDNGTSIFHISYEQTFMSHFGATKLLISNVENQLNDSATLISTCQGQDIEILTLQTSYDTLVSQVSTLTGNSTN